MNPLDFLNPLNIAAEASKKLVDVWTNLTDRKDRETTSIIADLTDLIEELRKTHSTIVKLVSPLRRIADDPMAFGNEFKKVYNDFRDFYDAYDFGNERTRCHKIRQIQNRMLKRKPLFGVDAQWNQLHASLRALSSADFDIIDNQYKPFMALFDKTMNSINQHVDNNDISLAIAEKTAFLASLGPDYDKNKRLLEEMTDTVGTLTAGL
jgi:hemerythrin